MPSPSIVNKVVLAYSGGLDTSVIVPWLRENYHCQVICFCADTKCRRRCGRPPGQIFSLPSRNNSSRRI